MEFDKDKPEYTLIQDFWGHEMPASDFIRHSYLSVRCIKD